MSKFPTSSPSTAQVWLLEPRDPVVLGDGRSNLSQGGQNVWPFPQPGTIAGMVRTTLVRGRADVSPELALKLLEVRIRGPWVVCPENHVWLHAPADALLAEGEADQASSPSMERLRGASLLRLETEREGVHWFKPPEDDDPAPTLPMPRRVVDLPERDSKGKKARAFTDALWPLDFLVYWGLGLRPETQHGARPARFEPLARDVIQKADAEFTVLLREHRTHVSLDDTSGTAEPGALFGSSGARLQEGWKLGLEVTVPSPQASQGSSSATQRPSAEPLVLPLPEGNALSILGGESRLSFLSIQPCQEGAKGAFPSFKTYEDDYLQVGRERIPHGLRIQLMTPAWLPIDHKREGRYHPHGAPGWCPSWLLSADSSAASSPSTGSGQPRAPHHPAIRALLQQAGQRLVLEALCMTSHQVVSGWNLQGGRAPSRSAADARIRQRTGAPREVRRLVPPGTVYYLSLEPQAGSDALSDSARVDLLLELCRALWGQTLDPAGPCDTDTVTNHAEFRAPASADGYGLILPGYWYEDNVPAAGAPAGNDSNTSM